MKKIIVFLTFAALLGCASKENLRNSNEIRVEGMYMYYADAALLFRCDNGQKIPVRGGEGNIQLETMYSQTRRDFGDKVYVELSGYYEQVDKMDGMGKELAFFVTEVHEMDADRDCF